MSSGSEESDSEVWVEAHCRTPGNEFLCEVERSFIEDAFNLYGLRNQIPYFEDCVDIILDRLDVEDLADPDGMSSLTAQLYGMIHARFILTAHGLNTMFLKYRQGDFGCCPRMLCAGQNVVPVGTTVEPNHDTVKLYCPKCGDVYLPPSGYKQPDGAFFGPTFPHLFFMMYDKEVPIDGPQKYVPRIFGFRIHHSSASVAHLNREENEKTEKSGNETAVLHAEPSAQQHTSQAQAEALVRAAMVNTQAAAAESAPPLAGSTVVVVPDRSTDSRTANSGAKCKTFHGQDASPLPEKKRARESRT